MTLTLSIFYETTAGERCSAGAFQFDDATLTLRELIRVFVQQEAKRFNEAGSEVFRGLVQPDASERILNGVRERPVLDWEKQFDKAIAAFKGNGFLVLLDERQITDLDETLHLTPESQLTFLKLVPLMGGQL
jgi:hypothetical protein